jgi:hypothetical protein
MQAQTTVQNRFINSITQGDCIQIMRCHGHAVQRQQAASNTEAGRGVGRGYMGIELDAEYFHHASARLERVKERIAARQRSSQVLIPTMR